MKINFNETIGKIKPMHAINNMPLLGATDKLFHYIGEAGVPYSRLHDTGGAYGGGRFVDIANVFRNFDADVDDPASYDFAFTDWLLNAIDKQNTKIFYRLGATIENQQNIKAYYIYPPKDNLKWAKICEKIIAHYNEGWANGYHLGIEYWEIWGEPDNYPDIEDNCLWKGTFEEYLELYKVASLYLKERFPDIKIGGFSSCGFYALFEDNFAQSANSSSRTGYFIECFHKFMEYVRENNLPLDFFSWHSYSNVEKNIAYEKYVNEQFKEYGLEGVESILNEWNAHPGIKGTLEDASDVASMMLEMQDTTVDMLMYYNGTIDVGNYSGMFNPLTHEPFKAYYAFAAFNELYKLGNQVKVSEKAEGISCVAARNGNKKVAVLNNRAEKQTVKIKSDCQDKFSLYRLNAEFDLEKAGELSSGDEIALEKFETVMLLSE
ncbi:MAG: hypothetical protein IJE44_06105 [Clostridia bacterium]|nr:hypothetical protein [Clostridia bacterium]